jgi:response regulator of citrate/malate metabolism
VLIVEDEFFIAMDQGDALREARFRILGLAVSVDHALEIIAGEKPDLAVLDVRLDRGLATSVAQALHSLGVPFVLTTAIAQEDLDKHEVLAGVTNLGKPTDLPRLVNHLWELAPQQAAGPTVPILCRPH